MDIDFYKWRNYIGITLVTVLCVIVFWKTFIPPNPKGKSPKAIVKLYYKARNSGNTDLLKQIMYFELGTTDKQKQSEAESVLAGLDEKLMLRSVGARITVKYQKYIDDNTAEVGIVGSSIFLPWKHYPINQIILKKQDGIWKYYHIMADFPKEIIVEMLKKEPQNFDLYFHLGGAYLDKNPAKAHRLYIKYYELAPKGFWVDEDFLRELKKYRKEFEDTEIYEKEMLTEIKEMSILSKTIRYQRLCQLFMEKKDYKKASSYLALAEETLKKDKSEYNYWKENLDTVKSELELRINGKYIDPLDEIEKSQQENETGSDTNE